MSAGRILVVDDDPQIRRVLKVTLTGQGFEVDDAKNGEEALERLRERRADLVLLDINMPGMSGLDVCRAMRTTSEVAIIMLTVRDEEADTVEALDAGADDYVTKPFKPSELSARIRAALRRSPGGQGPAGRLELGGTTIDFDTREATSQGRRVRFTPKVTFQLGHVALFGALFGPRGTCNVPLRSSGGHRQLNREAGTQHAVCLLPG